MVFFFFLSLHLSSSYVAARLLSAFIILPSVSREAWNTSISRSVLIFEGCVLMFVLRNDVTVRFSFLVYSVFLEPLFFSSCMGSFDRMCLWHLAGTTFACAVAYFTRYSADKWLPISLQIIVWRRSYKDDPPRFSKKGRSVYSSKLFYTGAILNFFHVFILDRFYIWKSCDGNLIVVRFATLHRPREAMICIPLNYENNVQKEWISWNIISF